MNDEMNIDEFEDWLKNQADKHRMYPSDQLWRNINQQLHEHKRWPALTFGAILTGALLTAALIFLHPDKNLFLLPTAPNTGSVALQNRIVKSANTLSIANTQALKPVNPKEAIYLFNYTVSDITEDNNAAYHTLPVAPENETLALNEPANSVPAPVSVPSITLKSATPVTLMPLSSGITDPDTNIVDASAVAPPKKNEQGIVDAAEELEQATTVANKTIRLPEVKKSRWNIEVYGGPNINYRRLTEPSSYDYHLPYNQALASNTRNNVNNVVKQRPSVGFNVGAAFTYALSKRVKLKAGLQFNFRQYNIDAFQSKFERSVLLLNNGFYYPDSVYTYSVISNDQGTRPLTLSNRYYQASTPIGIEWTAVQFQKVRFNLSANVQPTFQLNNNIYLITSDYKSYVQAPGLLRRMNINAGAEATANFDAGGLQWQVGPQILYQTMPTQKDNYSIREYLFDYGIRVGVVKKIR